LRRRRRRQRRCDGDVTAGMTTDAAAGAGEGGFRAPSEERWGARGAMAEPAAHWICARSGAPCACVSSWSPLLLHACSEAAFVPEQVSSRSGSAYWNVPTWLEIATCERRSLHGPWHGELWSLMVVDLLWSCMCTGETGVGRVPREPGAVYKGGWESITQHNKDERIWEDESSLQHYYVTASADYDCWVLKHEDSPRKAKRRLREMAEQGTWPQQQES